MRYIPPAALEQKAQEFLVAHHAALSIPVPIEEFVEFKLCPFVSIPRWTTR